MHGLNKITLERDLIPPPPPWKGNGNKSWTPWSHPGIARISRSFGRLSLVCPKKNQQRGYFEDPTKPSLTCKNIDIQLLPSLNSNRRETRSSDPNHQTFRTRQCKTTTYQKSFLNRSTRVWNVLPKALRSNNISLNPFRNRLFKYYRTAVANTYDAEDPRTWKQWRN